MLSLSEFLLFLFIICLSCGGFIFIFIGEYAFVAFLEKNGVLGKRRGKHE